MFELNTDECLLTYCQYDVVVVVFEYSNEEIHCHLHAMSVSVHLDHKINYQVQ